MYSTLLGGFYFVLQPNLKINLRKFCSQCFLQFGSCMYILPRTKNVLCRIRQMYSTLLGGFYFVLQSNLKINLRKFCSQCLLQLGSCMYILPRTKNVLYGIRQMYSTLLGGFYFVLQPSLKINLRKFCSQCFLQFGSCMYILPRTKNVLWAKLAKFKRGLPFRRTYPFLL